MLPSCIPSFGLSPGGRPEKAPQFPRSPRSRRRGRLAERKSPDPGPEIGRKWPEIGVKSTRNGAKRGRNRAKSARFRGGLGPPDGRPSSEKRGRRAERRLMATEIYDSNEEGRSRDRPGPDPRGGVRPGRAARGPEGGGQLASFRS